MLSQTAEYALRTVVFLAGRSEEPVRIDEIAAALDIPRNYLSKVLHRLARESVLTSTRGQGGGFRLASSADRIRLLDVIEPFDHIGSQRRCVLGREVCSDQGACEAHEAWKEVGARVAAFFAGTTVADLARGVARRRR
ncbi:MAG TPA: Rrf2 family transcriptional regulator [Gemmatimonadales bacterium]